MIAMPIRKSNSEKIAQVNTKENFKMLEEGDAEACLGDAIGSVATEESTHENH